MRNVRSTLLVAIVGLSLTTACSFSSSRSWGSAANPNNGSSGKGKPALHHSSKGKPAQQNHSNGKPAQKTPEVTPTPAPAPAPAPVPAADPPAEAKPPARVPREEPPARVPRDESPTSGAVGKAGTTLGTKADPSPAPIDGGKAKPKAAPKGLSIAPSNPDPPARGIKAAPNQ